MTGSTQVKLVVVGLACGLYGEFCAAVFALNLFKQPGSDFMVYYTAARAFLDGNLSLLSDGGRLTAYLNEYFADWLAWPLTFHAWVYPPHYLLILIPFGLLPFGISYFAFLAITFGALLAAVWFVFEPSCRRIQLFSLVFAPAVSFTVGTGQNAFLTSAILVGGFGLLFRHPMLAGGLLGWLSYKPQFALMVPVALVAARQWRAVVGAGGSIVVMVLISLLVAGIEPWRAWIEWVAGPTDPLYQTWITTARLHGESIYADLIILGTSDAAAHAGQWIALVLSGVCVWWCYRRAMPRDLQLAVLLAATILAAPHVAIYDTVLLVLAAAVIFARGAAEGFRRGELVVPVLVWTIQLFNPPSNFRIALITPVLTMLLIACAIARMRMGARTASALRCDLPAQKTTG